MGLETFSPLFDQQGRGCLMAQEVREYGTVPYYTIYRVGHRCRCRCTGLVVSSTSSVDHTLLGLDST